MKTTYILGAGASINSLPTYENFYQEFSKWFDILRKVNINEEKIFLELKKSAFWILNELKFHRTPDTLAKRLFISNSDKLIELKAVLTIFFLSKQLIIDEDKRTSLGKKVDGRYDSFIASICKPIRGALKFPDNLSVLNWNYDVQFELTVSQYLGKPLFDVINNSDNVIFPSELNNKGFSLIHLNGLAFHPFDNDIFSTKSDLKPIFKGLLEIYDKMLNKKEISLMNFAWESYESQATMENSSSLKCALSRAENTDVLVIIGYSFPIVNRQIDKIIFSKMDKSLSAIYIQNPEEMIFKKGVSTFFNGHKDKIFHITDKSEFFIPPQFDNEDAFNYGVYSFA